MLSQLHCDEEGALECASVSSGQLSVCTPDGYNTHDRQSNHGVRNSDKVVLCAVFGKSTFARSGFLVQTIVVGRRIETAASGETHYCIIQRGDPGGIQPPD